MYSYTHTHTYTHTQAGSRSGQRWQSGLEQVWACAVRARECVRVPVSVCVRARRCRWARCVAVPVCMCWCVCVGVCVMLLCMHLSVCVSCSSVCVCVGTLSAALLRCGVKEEQHVYSRACTPSARGVIVSHALRTAAPHCRIVQTPPAALLQHHIYTRAALRHYHARVAPERSASIALCVHHVQQCYNRV